MPLCVNVHLSIFNPASMHCSEKLGGFIGGPAIPEALSDSPPPPPQEVKKIQIIKNLNFTYIRFLECK